MRTQADINDAINALEAHCDLPPEQWPRVLANVTQICRDGGPWGNGLAVAYLKQVRRESRRKTVRTNGNGRQ